MNRKRLIGLIFATTIVISPIETRALTYSVSSDVELMKGVVPINLVKTSLYEDEKLDYKASSRIVFESIEEKRFILNEEQCEQGSFFCAKTGIHAFNDETLRIIRLEKETQEAERARVEEEERIEEERVQAENYRINNVRYYSNDLTIKSNISYDEMYNVLSNKTSGSMAHLAEAFVDAEAMYGVNALFMASLAALEGDWARSDRSIYQNNLTGMAVYSDDSDGSSYSSQYECIIDTARQIKEYYLDINARYYGGGLGSAHVGVFYCVSDEWSGKIDTIAYDLSNTYGDLYR